MAFIDMWNYWIVYAGAALGLATVLVAIVYMLSELLQNDKMKGWAKMELTEIFYSALIIAMTVATIPLIDAVVQGSLGVSNTGVSSSGVPGPLGSPTSAWIKTSDAGIFGGQSYQALDICGAPIAQSNYSVYHGIESCHIRLGIWYMDEVFNEAKNFAFDIYLSYIKTSMIADFTINIEFLFEKSGFMTFTPWKGFYTMGNKIKELLFDWAIKVMMLVKFQEVLLRFIATALFQALFIMGAVLRTFSFTRKIGGLLLAMAISLYFIYPSFYAFGALVMLSLKNDPQVSSAWLHDSTANPQGISNPDPPIAYTMYLRDNLTVPGGNGSYTTDEVRSRLQAYEGLSPQDYFTAVDQNGLNMTPRFDLSSNQYANASEAQQNASLATARAAADNWFGVVSKENKIDHFLDFAWLANGPIDALSRLTFWATFFSLFGILATIAAIRSLSITFGGDVEIAGLTRLI
jgi:hypothetical protein